MTYSYEKKKILVTGAGGFIGGWLTKDLLKMRPDSIRAVDIKPVESWYQASDQVENLRLDLRDSNACKIALRDVDFVFNLAADMGGMGFIETHKAECMLSVLINSNLLHYGVEKGISRFFG